MTWKVICNILGTFFSERIFVLKQFGSELISAFEQWKSLKYEYII